MMRTEISEYKMLVFMDINQSSSRDKSPGKSKGTGQQNPSERASAHGHVLTHVVVVGTLLSSD